MGSPRRGISRPDEQERERIIAYATDALYVEQHGPPPREHGYPAPIYGPSRDQATVVVDTVLERLFGTDGAV